MKSRDHVIMMSPALEEEYPMDICYTNLMIVAYPQLEMRRVVKGKVVIISCFSENITRNIPVF